MDKFGVERIYMNNFEKLLVTVFFIEVFVGGGGRLFVDFGFLSLRQVLFIGLILTFIFRIIKEKAYTNLEVNTFFRMNPVTIGVYLLIAWFFVSAIVGYSNGHSPSDIVTDFFRVSFFAAYFPLAYYISEDRFTKQRIITILKYCVFGVAVYTILIALLGKTVFSANFEPYKQFLKSIMTDNIVLRPSHSIFYKSHFFVFVGFILSLNAFLSKRFTKIDIVNIFLCALSLFWSETRGFLLAIMAALLMLIVIDVKIASDSSKGIVNKVKSLGRNSALIKKSIILLLISFSMVFLYKYMTLERYEETITESESLENVNDTSINIRLEYYEDSKRILSESPANFLLGTGYGTAIAGKTWGIEMSFLDILVEQGTLGLLLWFFLFFLVYYHYYSANKQGAVLTDVDRSFAAIFFGVLLLTNTNPFINNSIGITYLLIILILSRQMKERASNI